MKEFIAYYLFFSDCIKEFDESNPPSWLLADNGWYWRDHILKLEVGQSLKSDFQEILRVK